MSTVQGLFFIEGAGNKIPKPEIHEILSGGKGDLPNNPAGPLGIMF